MKITPITFSAVALAAMFVAAKPVAADKLDPRSQAGTKAPNAFQA